MKHAASHVPAVTILTTMVLAPAAFGQLTPDRLYYGVNRDIPMTVKVPHSPQS